MNTKVQTAISIFFPKLLIAISQLSFEIPKTIQSCFKCNKYFLLKLKYCACCICVFHYIITEPPKEHGEKMMGKRRVSAKYCNLFYFFKTVCFRVSTRKQNTHKDGVYALPVGID